MMIASGKTLSRTVQRKVRTGLRLLLGLIYRPQVLFRFSTAALPADAAQIFCPAGYALRYDQGGRNHRQWIDLLNQDRGFGHWDDTRLQAEILATLVAPDSVGFVYRGEHMVGCAAICRGELHRKPVVFGMFLIIHPDFRGDFRLANALFRLSLWLAARAGHGVVYASTFVDRKPALTLYLANDAEACYTSLWSPVQWYRIRRRLGPTAAKLRRRLAR